VPKNYVEAYKWFNLAAASRAEKIVADSSKERRRLELQMSPEQIAEAQQLSSEFKPHKESGSDNSVSPDSPTATGTGFFITDDGYLISNYLC
jgi:S1-C subfamily serine protease